MESAKKDGVKKDTVKKDGRKDAAVPASAPASAQTQTRRFRILDLEQPAQHLTVARLEPAEAEAFSFRAGQFARVRFDNLPARDLSLASRPGERLVEFHIRDLPREGASLFQKLKPGMDVTLEGPFGSGYLRENHAGPMLLAAGGSGIAPVKSIVEAALEKGMRQAMHVYFGVRDEPDLYLETHFEALAREYSNLRFVPVLSGGPGEKSRRAGRVGEAIAADFVRLAGWKAYVFGPSAMVHATARLIFDLGAALADIHTDEPVVIAT